MGKKTKTGKARKDKYYHLAKESGFRARSAFKLLQLNRKFQFLEKSRVCIDLCAAPGGWLQVAQQNMPISSLIIGVDLVAIKPMHNVVTFQEDITKDKCRQTLKKELQTWKADVVLHDGAPNVGKNWLHDAFQQAQLTLQALKLATGFLKKGGWFVSKVFRSKDYQALIWVLKQLFNSVHATKPQASRNESAEIFVVCKHYKAPDKLDPKFLDVKYVFKEVNMEPKSMVNLLHPEKVKKSADGYDENDTAFYHKLNASQFLESANHIELLGAAHEIVFDTEELSNHKLTTKELKECCKDIKVLGKKEIRSLLNWRKKLKKEEEDKAKEKEDSEKMDAKSASDDSDAEEANLDKQIADLETQKELDNKRKRKLVMKEKRKLRDKMELQMVHPGDHIEELDDVDLFDIKRIKSKHGLSEVQKEDLIDEDSDDDDDDLPGKSSRLMATYNRYKDEEEAGSESESEAGEYDESSEEDLESEDEMPEEQKNPLLVHLETKDVRVKKKTDMWFNKDIFSGLEQDCDEDLEIEKMAADYRKRGGVVLEKDAKNKTKRKQDSEDSGHASEEDMEIDMVANNSGDSDDDDDDDSDTDSSGDSDSDYDVHASLQRTLMEQRRGEKLQKKAARNKSSKDGFEVVPADQSAEKVIKLDPVELALGEQLIKSSKTRREMEELSYNRYTHGDESLPDWFAKDEARHSRKQLPITKDQIDYYKQRLQAINARPIKKIAEAKARKKRKMTKKLERARKKADTISDSVEISEVEKWKQIKDIYKRAGLLNKKKKEITYVVAKRGGGKKPSRPAGVKGFYKVVDKRMKQDKRYKKQQDKKDKKGKSKGKARVRR